MDVVTVYYQWRVGVYCRKELDNFQVEAASVEPRKKDRQKGKERKKERKKKERERKKRNISLSVIRVHKCTPPLVNCHVSRHRRVNRAQTS